MQKAVSNSYYLLTPYAKIVRKSSENRPKIVRKSSENRPK